MKYRKLKNLLVTGGAGFIGSNCIRYLLTKTAFSGSVVNFDKLTYAGNPANLRDLESDSRYKFQRGDICDSALVQEVLEKNAIDTIVHFAAESHVDRSISGPADFIATNINGTFTLLEAVRKYWHNRDDVLFHHISTDEVYGSLKETGYFTEDTPYDPRSPYSSSKASSDHLVRAYHHTYDLPITISNCSNNYGPFQFPEKLIPVMIGKVIKGEKLPVYGDGLNIRDWLYVEDHNCAVWMIMNKGRTGESYNIGGDNEWENIKLVNVLCEIVAEIKGFEKDYYKNLISFVKDRAGHDRRYAIDCSKLKSELGWSQSVTFDEGLRATVMWYLQNQDWVENVLTGEYLKDNGAR